MARLVGSGLIVFVLLGGAAWLWPTASAQEATDLAATVEALTLDVAELEREALNLRWQVRLLEGDTVDLVRVAIGQRATRAPVPGEFRTYCDIFPNPDDQTNPYNPMYVLRCR